MGLMHPDFWSEAIGITTPAAEKKYHAMKMVLAEIVTVAREHDMEVGLVNIPTPLQNDPTRHADWNPWVIGGVKLNSEWLTGESELQKRLANWSQGESIPFLDLTQALRMEVAQGGELNYKLDGHWNIEGHLIAGETIREWLDDAGVFSSLPAADTAQGTVPPISGPLETHNQQQDPLQLRVGK
jgi:hypothetical protein